MLGETRKTAWNRSSAVARWTSSFGRAKDGKGDVQPMVTAIIVRAQGPGFTKDAGYALKTSRSLTTWTPTRRPLSERPRHGQLALAAGRLGVSVYSRSTRRGRPKPSRSGSSSRASGAPLVVQASRVYTKRQQISKS